MNVFTERKTVDFERSDPKRIIVNGVRQPLIVKTLAELCVDAGAATALNGVFVPRSKRADIILHADDEVEILVPVQGG